MNTIDLLKRLLPVVVFSGAVLFSANGVFAQPQAKEKSLYQRLGGYDALAAVSDDFIGRLAANKSLGRFVIGLSNDSKKRLRQHFVEFLCSATGGSCVYLGRDMKIVHTGLGITDEDWKVSIKLLNETLDKFKVPEKERNEVLAAIESLKDQIVEKK